MRRFGPFLARRQVAPVAPDCTPASQPVAVACHGAGTVLAHHQLAGGTGGHLCVAGGVVLLIQNLKKTVQKWFKCKLLMMMVKKAAALNVLNIYQR